MKTRRTLWLIGAVCAVPVIASYFAFYVVQPGKTMNYGELLDPLALPDAPLTLLDGRRFALSALRGRWIMLSVDSSPCDERCRQKLYYMRQVRTAQGKEMGRIERVWVLRDPGAPPQAVLDDYPGMHVARAGATGLLDALPAKGDASAHVYLIDPLGNLMLRYPESPDPKRMVKDFERLLKYSRVG